MQEAIKATLLRNRNLGTALNQLKSKLKDADTRLKTRFDDIESDYNRMCDFVLTGGKDPYLEKLYDGLLRRTYLLSCSIEVFERRQKYANGTMKSGMENDYTERHESVKRHLESFVQESALASLLPESEQEQSLLNTKKAQRTYVSDLFKSLLVSDVWSDSTAEFTKELLSSPVVDTVDQQMMISAITLSLLNVFDVNKWVALFDVFCNSTDVKVQQRAFVGWVLTLPSDDLSLFPAVGERLKMVSANEDFRRQMVELQIQLYYCDNADADNIAIQKEILPTLEKNNHFRVTKSGIVEKEDDVLDDILHPDAEERNMEELEQTINKMVEMQKEGSDIYFGGFSQMKRYPFFNDLSNWFCPFYLENPALDSSKERLRNFGFMQRVLLDGPFCDSDKYSFVFATTQIFNRMPQNLREALNSADAIGVPTSKEFNPHNPTYVRRMYLQDMYRFFRLNYNRGEFESPFHSADNGKSTLFLSNKLLADTLSAAEMKQLYKFLFKHEKYAEILLMSDSHPFADDLSIEVIVATAHLRCQHYSEAEKKYRNILTKEPLNEQALKGMAHVAFVEGKYKVAVSCYEELSALRPESMTYAINRGSSLIKSGKIADGMARLFQLKYDYPNDKRVERALAWGYLVRGDAAQADAIYTRLLSARNVNDSDVLNAAFAKWALSESKMAIEMFRKYAKTLPTEFSRQIIREEIESENKLLEKYKISKTERKIMADMV